MRAVPFTLLLSLSGFSWAESGLDRIEKSLEDGSDVPHLDVDTISALLDDGSGNTYLFDIRERDEYAVSHLAGAVRIDPDIKPEDFLKRYGSFLGEGKVVFYCSVGRRSTKLAEEITRLIKEQHKGAGDVFNVPINMKGGIFHWHNDSMPLVNAKGQTDAVHPYSWFLKRLLTRKEKSRYLPSQ